jgi:hypothetical protein
MVVAYRPITKDTTFTDNSTYALSKFKILDWSLNLDNTIINQILIKTYSISIFIIQKNIETKPLMSYALFLIVITN